MSENAVNEALERERDYTPCWCGHIYAHHCEMWSTSHHCRWTRCGCPSFILPLGDPAPQQPMSEESGERP